MSSLVYSVANLAWQLGGDADLVRETAANAEVLVLVECRTRAHDPIDIARILGRGWQVQQSGIAKPDDARAGTTTAVRNGIKVRRTRLSLLSDASHEGDGVQRRHQRLTVLEDPYADAVVDLMGGHNPLPSTGRFMQARQNAQFLVANAQRRHHTLPKRRQWLWMGDPNTDPATWARALGAARHYGIRPMAACWSNGWGDLATSRRHVKGSDHYVLTIGSENHRG
jgi:hypothetical protein